MKTSGYSHTSTYSRILQLFQLWAKIMQTDGRNKCTTAIVPLSKVLEKNQLVFLVEGFCLLVLGLFGFFFASKSHINNFVYVSFSLSTISIFDTVKSCSLYTLGKRVSR